MLVPWIRFFMEVLAISLQEVGVCDPILLSQKNISFQLRDHYLKFHLGFRSRGRKLPVISVFLMISKVLTPVLPKFFFNCEVNCCHWNQYLCFCHIHKLLWSKSLHIYKTTLVYRFTGMGMFFFICNLPDKDVVINFIFHRSFNELEVLCLSF